MRKRKDEEEEGEKSVESRTNNRQKDQKEQHEQKKREKWLLFFSLSLLKKGGCFFLFLSLVRWKKYTRKTKNKREFCDHSRTHIFRVSIETLLKIHARACVCVCMFFVCIFSSKFLKTEEIRLLFLCVFWGGLEKVRQTTDQKRRNERKKRRRKNWFVFALFSLSLFLSFFFLSFFIHYYVRFPLRVFTNVITHNPTYIPLCERGRENEEGRKRGGEL